MAIFYFYHSYKENRNISIPSSPKKKKKNPGCTRGEIIWYGKKYYETSYYLLYTFNYIFYLHKHNYTYICHSYTQCITIQVRTMYQPQLISMTTITIPTITGHDECPASISVHRVYGIIDISVCITVLLYFMLRITKAKNYRFGIIIYTLDTIIIRT